MILQETKTSEKDMIFMPNEPFMHDKVRNTRMITSIHSHDEHELYYMLKGKTKFFIGDNIYEIKSGDFAFVQNGILHKTDGEDCLNRERIIVSFDDSIFDERTLPIVNEIKNQKVFHIPENKLVALEDLLYKIENEFREDKKYHSVLFNTYVIELLVLLLRYRYDNPTKSDEYDVIIHSVADFIKENYSNNISLETLSRKFSMSKSHISRKFKSYTGIGINEYITYVRISEAQRMLRESNLSVTKISQQCGFNDSNYFSNVFKKLKGVTPKSYQLKVKTKTK